MNKKFFHSVYLDESLCKGCINCIKRCPTQAIRVRNGKARITSQFCIDSTTTHTRLLFLHLLCMHNSITWMMSIFC